MEKALILHAEVFLRRTPTTTPVNFPTGLSYFLQVTHKSRPIPNQLLPSSPAIFFSFSSFQFPKSSPSFLELVQRNFPFLDLFLVLTPGNSHENHVAKLVLHGAP